MIQQGHRVRQRSWKDAGSSTTYPAYFRDWYDEGMDSFDGLPIVPAMLWGSDWEIVEPQREKPGNR
jgi:hypothetical protein